MLEPHLIRLSQRIVTRRGNVWWYFKPMVFFLKCFRFSWLVIKSLASLFEMRRCREIFNNLETKPRIKWLQQWLGNKCWCNNIWLVESDTLGNVQNKCSNTISPHSFGTWSSIWTIVKATHLYNCIIHQHTFMCIWVVKHKNWYHMTIITGGFISICWHILISHFIIICNIRSGCVFLSFVNII